jgi:hypothetical protein
VACAICLGFVLPASASALEWSVRQLQGEAGKIQMFGASCPTVSFCAVVGGQNTVATSTDPTGPLASWNTAYVGAGAVPTAPNSIFEGGQIRGVSCTSSNFCIAVSHEGLVYASTNPTGGAGAWKVTELEDGANTHMYGVSCIASSFCIVAADKGRIVSSTNPMGGKSAWTTVELGNSLKFRSVSCPSPSFCVVVGDEGMVLSSTNPLGGAAAWKEVQLPGMPSQGFNVPSERDLYGVSCPLPALCVTGNSVGDLLVSTEPTGGVPAWDKTDGGGSVQLTAADCISASRCVLVDNNADVLASTNPTGGPGAWSFTNLIPYGDGNANAIFGLSCPSPALCVAAGAKGKIFTIANPLAEEKTTVVNGGKKRHGPKRPRALLADGPAILIAHNGWATVRLRFYAKGPVRRFLCKVDRHRFKPCKSPKVLRVRAGRHVFKVRAVGLTGLKGKVATGRFQVFRPSEWPPKG